MLLNSGGRRPHGGSPPDALGQARDRSGDTGSISLRPVQPWRRVIAAIMSTDRARCARHDGDVRRSLGLAAGSAAMRSSVGVTASRSSDTTGFQLPSEPPVAGSGSRGSVLRRGPPRAVSRRALPFANEIGPRIVVAGARRDGSSCHRPSGSRFVRRSAVRTDSSADLV